MTKEQIINKIKKEVLGMNLRESYINDSLSDVYTKWYIDSEGDLYSIQADRNDNEPEAAWKGEDRFLWSIRPKDIENVQFDELDEDGNAISDEDYAKSLTDDEFLDAVFGNYYDNKLNYCIDTDFEGYLEHEIGAEVKGPYTRAWKVYGREGHR